MNPTNQNQGGHSQSQRSFTFGPIDLEMLNGDVSSARVPTQAYNEVGRAFNSDGTIPPVHPQAPSSFPPINVHPGGSYMPSGSFPAGPLPVNLYLPSDGPPLSQPPSIGALSAGPPPPGLQAGPLIPGMPAGPPLASLPAGPPILGPPAGPPAVSGPYTFGTRDFGGPRWPNTPSFFPTPVQRLDNANIRRSISPTPSSPISWSPSPPPPSHIPPLPAETEPTPSSSRERNVRDGRAEKAGRAGRSGRRGGQGRGNTRGGNGQSRESRQNSPREADQELQGTQGRRKTRNRGMTPQEKLALIRECCEHAGEYKPRNKTAFWEMIRGLLKDRTGYDLLEPRLTVMRWVKTRIDELVEEEMGSGTQVEQDDFKAAVEQFAIRVNEVQLEVDSAVKDKQTQAAELFEAAKLQSAMVFGLDDEPIAGIESTPGVVTGSGASIALNSARKRKREEGNGPSSDAILLSETFERSTTVLAQALVKAQESSLLPAASGTSSTSDNSAAGIEKKMTEMEHRIEARIESRWDDMQSKLDRILAAIVVQRSNNGGGSTSN